MPKVEEWDYNNGYCKFLRKYHIQIFCKQCTELKIVWRHCQLTRILPRIYDGTFVKICSSVILLHNLHVIWNTVALLEI